MGPPWRLGLRGGDGNSQKAELTCLFCKKRTRGPLEALCGILGTAPSHETARKRRGDAWQHS